MSFISFPYEYVFIDTMGLTLHPWVQRDTFEGERVWPTFHPCVRVSWISEQNQDVPKLYWIPKLHKNPYKDLLQGQPNILLRDFLSCSQHC